MDCKKFAANLNDYLNHTLAGEAVDEARAHAEECTGCAALADELQRTTALLQSMGRKTAPIGFDERLKARMAAQSSSRTGDRIPGWLRGVVHVLIGRPSTGRRWMLRPVLAAVLLCGIIVSSLFYGMPVDKKSGSETDWAYIQSCRTQHESYAETNPLNDESAILLKEQSNSSDADLESAVID
jgi:hypothetical protein